MGSLNLKAPNTKMQQSRLFCRGCDLKKTNPQFNNRPEPQSRGLTQQVGDGCVDVGHVLGQQWRSVCVAVVFDQGPVQHQLTGRVVSDAARRGRGPQLPR